MSAIKSKKQIIICCAVVIISVCVVLLYWLVFYKMIHTDKVHDEMIGPGALQSIEVRITSVSDNEIYCTTDEEIEGSKALNFQHFDKGADIVLKNGEGDFAGAKYQAGDRIKILVFDCEDDDGKVIITTDRTQIQRVKQ